MLEGPLAFHLFRQYPHVRSKRPEPIIDPLADRGSDPYPRKIRFTTWTLAYNRMKWIVVDGLEQRWERATVAAEIADDHTVTARTSNITALTMEFGPAAVRSMRSSRRRLSWMSSDW